MIVNKTRQERMVLVVKTRPNELKDIKKNARVHDKVKKNVLKNMAMILKISCILDNSFYSK